MGTHYSWGQQPDKLQEWCARALNEIDSKVGRENLVLCYRGMSGTSHAVALSFMMYQVWHVVPSMVYVRKDEEVSHGSPVESHLTFEGGAHVIFVDDLVCGGNTRSITLTTTTGYMQRKGHRISGVWSYTGMYDGVEIHRMEERGMGRWHQVRDR